MNVRHEADLEVATADKADRAAKAAKATKPKSPHVILLGWVIDRLDCSEDSWAEATPGRLQGNYLMQHDETTASPNDSQREWQN